jgi:hypothetical protein
MAGSPGTTTVKQLFAVSGNRCAFPDCTRTLVEVETGTVTGEICHIHAQSEGGPRYCKKQTDAERHGVGNLVLQLGGAA